MKRLCMLGGLVAVLAVPAVQAQMQVTLYQDLSNYSYSNGGEFNAVPNAELLSVNPTLAGYTGHRKPDGPYFQTCCIETSEEFSPGSTYDVAISQDIKTTMGSSPVAHQLRWALPCCIASLLRAH